MLNKKRTVKNAFFLLSTLYTKKKTNNEKETRNVETWNTSEVAH